MRIVREPLEDRLELVGGDLCRWGAPAVAIAKQHDEVGTRRRPLTAIDLAQADVHRLMVETRLLTHPPADIDRLEPGAVLLTALTQLFEYPLL